MKTDDLIARLGADLAPTPPHYVGRVLAMGLGLGVLVSAALMLAAMGPRPDLAVAMAGGAFWMKLAYTLSFAGLGLWMVERLGRSDASASRVGASFRKAQNTATKAGTEIVRISMAQTFQESPITR